MKIHVEGTAYDYSDQRKLLVSEAILIQEHTGLLVGPWRAALQKGDPLAIKALVLILKLRAGETPTWDTLDFDLAETLVEVDKPVTVVTKKSPKAGTRRARGAASSGPQSET